MNLLPNPQNQYHLQNVRLPRTPILRKPKLFPDQKQVKTAEIFQRLQNGILILVWPRSTRHRLFLPYFQVICPLHANFVCINQNYLVGKGKFGTVFAGEIINKRYQSCIKCAKTHQMMQTPEDGRVAVKELKKSVVLKNEAEVQIIEETRIHSVCSGLPNILPFIKAWQDAHHLYVAFPVCHRGTLADLFVSRKAAPFPSQSILVAAHQLFKGKLGRKFRDASQLINFVFACHQGVLLVLAPALGLRFLHYHSHEKHGPFILH